MVILPADALPQSDEGFYATNNPFLVNGPKGFTELKLLENEDMFVRIDLPGAGIGGFSLSVDKSKKNLTAKAFAPILNVNDSAHRIYDPTTVIICDICEITGFVHDLSDGVLRLTIFKTHSPGSLAYPSSEENIEGPCLQGSTCTDPDDPELTGPTLELHPFQDDGPPTAYEYKRLPDGSLYVRLDMPGVPKDQFIVSVEMDRVMVDGKAPAVSYDSGERVYSGVAALLSAIPVGQFPNPKLTGIAENGVIRILISPPLIS